jgi:hypothetical protein
LSAKLVIRNGVATIEYWIERKWTRLGRNPGGTGSEIVLDAPGLAPHALSFEFRDGRYYVHNKTPQAVSVGGKPAPSGSASTLDPDAEVVLNESIRVRLVVVGDPAPSPKPTEIDLGRQEAPAPVDDPARRRRLLLIAGVIAGLTVLFVLIATIAEANAPIAPVEQSPLQSRFQAIVEGAMSDVATPTMRMVRPILQHAFAAETRRGAAAGTHYRFVRDALLGVPGANRTPLEVETLGFVNSRIAALQVSASE